MCLAIPGKIETIDGADPIFRSGSVNFGGIRKTVNLACVPDAQPGNYVMVHAGMAISVVDEAEARKTLDCLKEISAAAALDVLP